ncbi:apolipoprotein A1/A4/E family protein [Bacillus cereus]|uniref:apolipoprotein A1/A4/E family protein n=1 Tax=Bacillus cereus TaxID=1396 RepID=UPI001CD978D6|nr:apolipoprotein A1/A4/E family protein [Bacillus cereus]
MAAIIGGITIAASAMTPALLGGLGAVASLFGTAGVAAAGFGALAFTTISKTVETANQLEEAQLKANAALIAGDTKGYAKQMALIQAIMESLTDEEKKAVVAINNLSDAWREMENQMAPTTLNLIANSTDFLRLTMTKLFPSFQGVGQSFSNMIGKMNEGITQGKADKFFEHMNTFAVPMFEMVMKSAGNILKGFSDIMIAFTPLGMDLGNGMVDLTQKFANWAAGLQSNTAFQDFVNFVKTSTPVIMQFIGNLVLTLWDIIQALAPVSIQVFELANRFMEWARESGALDTALGLVSNAIQFVVDNANWLIPLVAALWAGFKTFSILISVATWIDDTGKAINKVIEIGKLFGSWILDAIKLLGRLSMTLLASPWFWVVAAIAAVIAIGVLLYQNWDEVKKYAQELWDKVKDAWNGMTKAIGDAHDKMIQAVKQWWNETKQKWNDMVENAKAKAQEMKDKVVAKYEELKQAAIQKIQNLLQDNANKWNSLVNDAKQKVSDMKQSVVDKFNQLKTDAVNKLQSLLSDTKQKFNDMVQAAKDKISSFKQAGTDMLARFKDAVVDGFNKSMDSVYKGVNNMVKQVKEFLGTFKDAGKGLLSAFTDGVKSGIQKAKNAVSDGMAAIRAYLPFSPAKKGPLSDLDKSGEAFFPTWYEAALTQVRTMQRAVGGAFSGVAKEANVALAGTGLEAFTGGKSTMTVIHKHEHTVSGEVDVNGEKLKATVEQKVTQAANEQGYSGMNYGSLNQAIRQL